MANEPLKQGARVGHGLNGGTGLNGGRFDQMIRVIALINAVALALGMFWLQGLNTTLARMEERLDSVAIDLAEVKGNRFTSADHATLMTKINDDHERLWAAIFECGIANARQDK